MDQTGRGPKLPKRNLDGQAAEDAVAAVVHRMGHVMRPPGLDTGLDGYIELRDQRTEEPIARMIGVQVKARSKFAGSTQTSFEFRCEDKSINGWLRSRDPVLLVCVDITSEQMWFKCVTEWFQDRTHRASRTVAFDRDHDVFHAGLTADLLRLGATNEPTTPRLDPTSPERLVTNLMPLIEPPEWIWRATTDLRTYRGAKARYAEVGGRRASDYILRDDSLYSFRHPSSCELGALCDADEAERIPFSAWAESPDQDVEYRLVDLFQRALLQQLKPTIRWHPLRRLFYFASDPPHRDLDTEGPNGKRLAIKVKTFKPKSGPKRIAWIRHQAFQARFVAVEGVWHLALTPNFLFTYDGEHETDDAFELLAGIKRLDRQLAVIGHLKFWEHVLRPKLTLAVETPILTLGPLVEVEVARGIDDDLWEPTTKKPELPGQEQLAI